jgi:hypothetical protein
MVFMLLPFGGFIGAAFMLPTALVLVGTPVSTYQLAGLILLAATF